MSYFGPISIYRHRLPHWRGEGATYFVTWRVRRFRPERAPEERDEVVSALQHFDGDRLRLPAFVVMNDHVHTLVSPSEAEPLEMLVHSWKSFSANRIQALGARQGHVWQHEYFDRIIRDEGEFLEKARYIVNNPWKRWPEITAYRWVGMESQFSH
jgi:REP element-mobilizing transposase RayT